MRRGEGHKTALRGKVFEYLDMQVRTIMKDGQVWFVAKDVCDVLEIGNISLAVNGQTRHNVNDEPYQSGGLDDDEKLTFTLQTSGQSRNVIAINEPGLYNLIFKSKKPEAKQFKRWITHEVLPSIRETGDTVRFEGREEVGKEKGQSIRRVRVCWRGRSRVRGFGLRGNRAQS